MVGLFCIYQICLSCRMWNFAKIFIWNAVLFLLTLCILWLKCNDSVTDLWETVLNCMHVYVKIEQKKNTGVHGKHLTFKWLARYMNFGTCFKQSDDLTERWELRVIVLHCLCYEILRSYRHLTLQKTVSQLQMQEGRTWCERRWGLWAVWYPLCQ